MKPIKDTIIIAVLAGILLAAGLCAAQGEENDPNQDVLSSKAFPELRVIDGISAHGVTISDVLYRVAESVQYYDDGGEPTDLEYFTVGDLVFFSFNGSGEINGMWKEQKD